MPTFRDLSLPKPLLEPAQWAWPLSSSQDSTYILSLALATRVSGPISRIYNEAILTGRFIWRVEPSFFSQEKEFVIQNEVSRAEAIKWLTKGQPQDWLINPSDLSAFASHFADLKFVNLEKYSRTKSRELSESFREPTLYEWLCEIAPELLENFGELKVRKYLKLYGEELPSALTRPTDGLRFFAGFLKKAKDLEAAVLFDQAWARFSAFSSPHDEVQEQKSLQPDEIMLNPTMQITRDIGNGNVRAYLRFNDQVMIHELSWPEAVVFEQVEDHFRIPQKSLLKLVLTDQTNQQVIKLQDLHGGVPKYDEVIRGLIEKRLLLCGR